MASTIELLRQGGRTRSAEVLRLLGSSLEEFAAIQRRLADGQIGLLGRCEMGRRSWRHRAQQHREFREVVPTTTYKDYAPYLMKSGRMHCRPNL